MALDANLCNAAKSEKLRVKEDTDLMMKAKGQICSQILEKQRKMAALESDSCTLSQVTFKVLFVFKYWMINIVCH